MKDGALQMNSIGIMTWYKYKNYGTALQAVALYTILNKKGYLPKVINYSRKDRFIEEDQINVNGMLNKAKKRLLDILNNRTSYVNKETSDLFSEFISKHLKETYECNTYSELENLNAMFDTFICGSDQIWNPNYFDDKYFLSFVKDYNKKIAYAPSFGVKEIINKEIRNKIGDLLNSFDSISVRELDGKEILEKTFNKKSFLAVDPTLLLNKEEWNKLIDYPLCKKIKGKYILCYFLGDYHKYKKAVEKISKILGMNTIYIPMFKNQRVITVPFSVGPNEFVSLIEDASYVCTDSYHGMLFSLNFNIPFSIFPRFSDKNHESQNSRIKSLLNILSLSKLLINDNTVEKVETIDWGIVNKKIDWLRRKSIEFLISSIASKKKDDTHFKKENIMAITKNCCGCGTCVSMCPKNAISMVLNDNGFYEYKIDYNICVGCRLCVSVCPMNNINATPINRSIDLFSFKYNDKEILRWSSSGGFSYAVTSLMNELGYYICGVRYNRVAKKAEHYVIDPSCSEELRNIQGSKYLQSDSCDSIKRVCSLSKSHRIVFTGTPCQCSGLNNLLEKKGQRGNVVLIDLICHGIPSSFMFRKYMKQIIDNYNISDNPYVFFRYGEKFWRDRHIYIGDDSNKYMNNEKKDDFYRLFRRSFCYADSCYECPYRDKSSADLRIGDFWGNKFKNDKSGVSMVMSFSEIGDFVLLKLMEANVGILNHEIVDDYYINQNPVNPSEPLFRKELIENFKDDTCNIHDLADKYCSGYDLYEKLIGIKGIIEKIHN